jgi:hypothetical protein
MARPIRVHIHVCPRCGGEMALNKEHSCGPSARTSMHDREDEHDGSMDDRIRLRAYEIYVARGRQDGHALEDWSQAENELHKSEKGC